MVTAAAKMISVKTKTRENMSQKKKCIDCENDFQQNRGRKVIRRKDCLTK
jgi:hypothetical protein